MLATAIIGRMVGVKYAMRIKRASGDAIVHPHRHQDRERDRNRNGPEREPEIVQSARQNTGSATMVA